MASAQPTHPISALPLPPPSQLLIHRLTPDTHTPSVSTFRSKVLPNTPSLQRRARLLAAPCHFSHLTPMPLPFPYDIEPPPAGQPIKDKGAFVERWLSAREAVHERPLPPDTPPRALRIYDAKNRDQPRILLGISQTGLMDCVPHLDVGDAFEMLGTPSLARSFEQDGDPKPSDDEEVVKKRQELVDVLSGHSTLMTPPSVNDDEAFAPWSLRYSGHQFGSWAGQLGDGRAISVLVTPHPDDPNTTYELQLKGAGRTPFSRSADGLAVLRSSIREYLCSEGMHALGIPTTRSLSLIHLPSLPVARERVESACVMTRVAPSFLRIGSFEALNGPPNMFFFGGGQQDANWEALRILGEWVAGDVLRLEGVKAPDGKGMSGRPWGRELVLEVARRNAKMVAGWQAYGFMHGVMNTDNVSVLGLTIDYGPYAFMDVFDWNHICNHTDEGGRYAYRLQPAMILFALRALLDALSHLIGAESELGTAVPPGWADGASKAKLDAWRKEGLKLRDELERVAQHTTAVEYARLMRQRLGLRREEPTDEPRLFKPLLDLLETHRLDFHKTFRTLAKFRSAMMDGRDVMPEGGEELRALIQQLLEATPEPARLDYKQATADWMAWLETYAVRIEGEVAEWGGRGMDVNGIRISVDVDGEREREMRRVNPRFVLRQWVLEEVIKKVERDVESGRRLLAKVMQMACNPFEPWGAEGDPRPEEELDQEEREERRYCGMGDLRLLGFQCSCSS